MTGGCPQRAARAFGAAAQVGAEIDAPIVPELGIGLPGLCIERIHILADARENPLVRSATPAGQPAIVSTPRFTRIEPPAQLAGCGVDCEDFLSGGIGVENSVDDDGIGFERAGSIPRIKCPRDLKLAYIGLVDLF